MFNSFSTFFHQPKVLYNSNISLLILFNVFFYLLIYINKLINFCKVIFYTTIIDVIRHRLILSKMLELTCTNVQGGKKMNTISLSKNDIKSLLPHRPEVSHKYTFGRVVAVCGSEGMCGAAHLCAKAAYRTGCGLVEIVTPEQNRIPLQTSLPSTMASTTRWRSEMQRAGSTSSTSADCSTT